MAHILVIGSGIAGLTAALRLSTRHRVTLVTKDGLGDSNSEWAQGGIAGVLVPDDSVAAHIADTMAAGSWINDAEAVRVLCTEGPDRILELAALGVEFDRAHDAASTSPAPLTPAREPLTPAREPLTWARGLEGAHSVPRIYHSGGDATGKAIIAALTSAARASAARTPGPRRSSSLVIREHTMLLDLVRSGKRGSGCVTGARLLTGSEVGVVAADAVVLATGGAGQLYAHTTNPSAATGDGLAAAMRAGAEVADLEFFQFHPTALAGSGFLLSEALRGAGAVLLDAAGHRFMPELHPLAELAPRDVVALAIHREMAAQGLAPCLLDATGVPDVAGRFPTIAAGIAAHGFDLATQPIPVTPAAHYFMGGIVTDLDGRTSLDGLWAIGEVARSGVHGANRLASNSLLEGAVFAVRAAEAIHAECAAGVSPHAHSGESGAFDSTAVALDATTHQSPCSIDRARLTALAWDRLGIERDGVGLHHALDELDLMTAAATSAAVPSESSGRTSAAARSGLGPGLRAAAETANLALVATGIARAALAREESIGAHTRTDFPARTSPDLAYADRAAEPRFFDLQEA